VNYNTEENIKKRDDDKFCFIANNSKDASNKIWLIDSGATNHIACSKEMFEKIEPYHSTIKLGDGRPLAVKGIGEIKVKIISNNKELEILISEVLYVPEMNTNLLSISRLDKKGYRITFENQKCLIRLNDKHIAEGIICKHNKNLYQLKTISNNEKNEENYALLTNNENN
jgi:hypothetical protein